MRKISVMMLITVLVLLIPFIAMFFTTEVKWSSSDFVVAGAFIFAMLLTYELIARKISTAKYRMMFGVVFALIFFLVWVELAVGIFN